MFLVYVLIIKNTGAFDRLIHIWSVPLFPVFRENQLIVICFSFLSASPATTPKASAAQEKSQQESSVTKVKPPVIPMIIYIILCFI